MKKKLAAALLAIAMLAASLAGCSSPSSSQPAGSTSSSASTAESGEKVLTIAQGGDITRLHTFRPDGYSFRQRLASTVPEYDMSFLLSFFFHYNRSITLRSYRLSLLLPLPGFPLLKYLAALR